MGKTLVKSQYYSAYQSGLLIVLVLLIFGSTATYDYALDDAIYITDNSFTQKGLSGIIDHLQHESLVGFHGEKTNLLSGGRYRPLAPITYSIEYWLYGFNPGYSHIINLILYIALLLLLIKVLRRFDNSSDATLLSLGFIATVIYAVHPLHVEVVANIKGRDQILALIMVFLTTLYSFDALDRKRWYYFAVGILFFLGLLAKESTITFLPLIPLAYYFFKNKTVKELAPLALTLIISSGLWLALRATIVDGFDNTDTSILLNNPFFGSSLDERYATMIYTWLLYLKLLVVPYPLTYDYYPFHISIKDFSSIWPGISFAIHVALAFIAIRGLKKKSFFSFIIILYAATFSISSNLFFNIGTFMNERFLFEPSLAFCLLLGWVISRSMLSLRSRSIILLLITLVFASISFDRSFAWRDNYTLFTTDVKVSSNSLKSLVACGGIKLDRAREVNDAVEKDKLLDESIFYLKKATTLWPQELNSFRLLGHSYYEKNGLNEETIQAYLNVLSVSPNDIYLIPSIEHIISQTHHDPSERLRFARRFEPYFQNSFVYNLQMGLIYGQGLGDISKSLEYLKKAESIEPNNLLLIKNLGAALAISGSYAESNQYLLRAEKIAPNDKEVLSNIALNYLNMKMIKESQSYTQRANSL